MTYWEFAFIVEGLDFDDFDLFEELYEAGLDDSTIGQTAGVQSIWFSREAASFSDAAISALHDVASVPVVTVLSIQGDPEFSYDNG